MVGLKQSGQDKKVMLGRSMRISAIAQICRVFNFVKRICKSRCVLLLLSGKIHTLSMSSGVLKNQTKKISGRATPFPLRGPC